MAKILVIVPAYNESKMIQRVIMSIPSRLFKKKVDILVVDDGSTDNTSKVVKGKNVTLIRHLVNRGLGAALATGFAYAKNQNYEIAITFDADGQHSSVDLPRMLKPLISGQADVVIGSRLSSQSSMPILRKMINYSSNIITFLLFNIWTTDSQSGLRAFNQKALNKIRIRSQRMEVSSEIFKEIGKNRLKVIEVPVKTIYTKYSLTKGQQISNAPRVFWKLVQQSIN